MTHCRDHDEYRDGCMQCEFAAVQQTRRERSHIKGLDPLPGGEVPRRAENPSNRPDNAR